MFIIKYWLKWLWRPASPNLPSSNCTHKENLCGIIPVWFWRPENWRTTCQTNAPVQKYPGKGKNNILSQHFVLFQSPMHSSHDVPSLWEGQSDLLHLPVWVFVSFREHCPGHTQKQCLMKYLGFCGPGKWTHHTKCYCTGNIIAIVNIVDMTLYQCNDNEIKAKYIFFLLLGYFATRCTLSSWQEL